MHPAENLAASPGAVVLRTDVFELIQYRPRTPEVHEVPMLIEGVSRYSAPATIMVPVFHCPAK